MLRDIDNHYARLLLESRSVSDKFLDYYVAFKKAHDILVKQMLQSDTRNYPYKMARNYQSFVATRKAQLTPSDLSHFAGCCRQILQIIGGLGQELSRDLLVAECKVAMEKAIVIAAKA